MVQRLGDIALKYQLINLLLFGTMLKHSRIDVVATLTHNVEKTFRKKEILILLLFDIK